MIEMRLPTIKNRRCWVEFCSLISKRSIAEKELERRIPGLAQTHIVDLRLPIKQLPRSQLEAFSLQMISILTNNAFLLASYLIDFFEWFAENDFLGNPR